MSLQYAKQVLTTEIEAISKVRDRLDESFEKVLDTMEQCRGRVVTCGMGKAGQIATKISATLASTGTPSFFLHPAEALHGDLGMVQPEDVILMFSNSGESIEITQLLPFLRAKGVKIISMTGRDRSTLAVQSDMTISLGELDEACPLGLAPTATTTVMLAVGDALALCLMKRRGFQIEDYANLHPAGALGKKTLPVKLAMRVGDGVATATPDATIQDAILAITKARAGAAVVVDNDQKVLGIFCDGDLRRGIEADTDFLTRRLGDVMTPQCTTVSGDMKTGDVLDLMKDKRIGEVPVVDQNGKLLGLADMKGLISL